MRRTTRLRRDRLYSQSVAEHYSLPFGADRPFLPSNATTDTGQFIDSKSFPTAKYCGHCHQQAYAEWRQTVHANSFRNPWYVKNVNLLTKERGIEYTRHCEGCHNPIALTSGALTKGSPIDRHFDGDGITCSVCHSIQQVNTRGTGSYTMGAPAVMVDANGKPIAGEVPDKEILAHLDRHSKAVMKDFYRTSEFCSVCHKAALPRELNHYKWQRAIFLYDEWQQASFAKQSPLPFYVKDQVSTCQSCHMPKEDLTTTDYGAEDGKFVSHRWLGANTLLYKYYGYDEQLEKTIEFLQKGAQKTGALNVDLFGIERNGGGLIAPLGREAFDIAPGDVSDGFGGDSEQRDRARAGSGAARLLRMLGGVRGQGCGGQDADGLWRAGAGRRARSDGAQLHQPAGECSRHAERPAPGVGHARGGVQQHDRFRPVADRALSI